MPIGSARMENQFAEATTQRKAYGILATVQADPHVRKRWIRRLLNLGWSSSKIRRALHVESGVVEKLAKVWTKYPPKEIAEAEQLLRAGRKWREVSAKTGVSLATLQRRIGYRKYPELTAEQLAAALAKVQAGASWDQAAHELGVGHSTLKKYIAWRKPPGPKRRIDGQGSKPSQRAANG